MKFQRWWKLLKVLNELQMEKLLESPEFDEYKASTGIIINKN